MAAVIDRELYLTSAVDPRPSLVVTIRNARNVAFWYRGLKQGLRTMIEDIARGYGGGKGSCVSPRLAALEDAESHIKQSRP